MKIACIEVPASRSSIILQHIPASPLIAALELSPGRVSCLSIISFAPGIFGQSASQMPCKKDEPDRPQAATLPGAA